MTFLNNLKKKQADYLLRIASGFIIQIFLRQYELDVRLSFKRYTLFFLFLRNHSLTRYRMLTDLIVYDTPGELNRFTLVYCLLSEKFNTRLRVQFQLSELDSIRSLSNIYINAN